MNALILRKDAPDSTAELKQEKVDIPTPSETQVLVKVMASKLNPSDLLNATGGFPYTTYSRIPGRDYAGVVVKAPGDATLERKNVYGTSGNAVGFTIDGAHAEYILLPISGISIMPHKLEHAEAACVGVVYTTALMLIQRAQINRDQSSEMSVLIIGERGNVGTAIRNLLYARYPNIKITAANRCEGKMSLPSEGKFDVIFSTVPSTQTMQSALSLLDKHGKLLFIAATRPKSPKLEIDPLEFYRNEWSLLGINSLNITIEESKLLMDELASLFDSGQLSMPKDKAPRTVPFANARQAYADKLNAVFLM